MDMVCISWLCVYVFILTMLQVFSSNIYIEPQGVCILYLCSLSCDHLSSRDYVDHINLQY